MLSTHALALLPIFMAAIHANPVAPGNLTERYVPPPYCAPQPSLYDGGSAHQVYHFVQVTDGTDCGSGGPEFSCQTGEQTSYTEGWEATAGFNYEWFSADFKVIKVTSTGETNACNGSPGETVCVVKRTAYTTYQVTASPYDGYDCGGPPSKPYWITSPNGDGVGDVFICYRGTDGLDCSNKGNSWWNYDGPSGGPQDVPSGEYLS